MQQQTITFVVAGIGVGGIVLTHYLSKTTQEDRTQSEDRSREYKELISTITASYLRIVSSYEPVIPVIDEVLQRQINDAKLESFRVGSWALTFAESERVQGIGACSLRLG